MKNLRLLIELVVVVCVVLLFFGIFLGMLNFMFPTGTSFSELMSRGGILTPAPSRGKTGQDTMIVDQPVVLSKLDNTVKNKRSNDIVWTFAHRGLNLYNRDAVQTFKAASALLTLDKGESYLEIGENSLVIIRLNEKDLEKHEKRSLLVMVDGQLKGRITQDAQERRNVEISTSAGGIRIPAEQDDHTGTEFKVTINEDRSSTFTVLAGAADVTAMGTSVRVNENQSTTVRLNEAPPMPRDLPHEVKLIDPANEQVLYYRTIPPRVKFEWHPVAGEKEYRILIARDREFKTIESDEWVIHNYFVHGNLKEGEYYWKVALRKESVCVERHLRMMHITKPPAIQIESPPRVIETDHYVIKGLTDPDTRVIAEGQDVAVDTTGRFEHPLLLQKGVNIIVIEALDRAGNITYSTVRIYAKFK